MNITTVRNAMIKRAGVPTPTVQQPTQADAWKTAVNPATHKVAKGQTIDWMANKYGTTRQAILDLNKGLNPKALQIGQEIKLPQWTERRRIWETSKFDPEQVLPLDKDFLTRMRWVESSNNDNAYNSGTGATGPLQFTQIGLDEVNNIRKNQGLTALTMDNLKNWNTAQDAAEMLNQKWGRDYQYATGKQWYNDYYARRHNIGNNWENNDRGLFYLNKIYSKDTADNTGLEFIPGGVAGAPLR